MTAVVYKDPLTLYLRMLRRCVRTESGCWEFTGAVNSRGYSQVCSGKKSKSILGHQLVVLARGEDVPEGHNIDHSCHDSNVCRLAEFCQHRRCVNPAHIRVVTQKENTARQWESGLCKKGHPLTQKKRGRYCRTCHAAKQREYAARVFAQEKGPYPSCMNGRNSSMISWILSSVLA